MKHIAAFMGLLMALSAYDASAVTVDTWTKPFSIRDYARALENSLGDESVSALTVRGWSYFMRDDIAKALAAFRAIEREDAGNFEAHLGIAWCSIKAADWPAAGEYLRRAEDSADNRRLYRVLDAKGRMALERGDLAGAEAFFNEANYPAAETWTGPTDSRISRGLLEIKKDNWAMAESYFASGLKQNPKCYLCREGLARVALNRGDFEAALDHALQGLKVNDAGAGLNEVLAQAVTGLGDGPRGIEIYGKLIEAHPDNPTFHAGQGHVFLSMAKPEEAKAKFRDALRLDPANASANAGLAAVPLSKRRIVQDGWDAYHRGDYLSALVAFDRKRLEAARAGNPAAEDGRGWTLLAVGKAVEARTAFQDALRIDPEFATSVKGLAEAEAAVLHRYNEAWQLVRQGRHNDAELAFYATQSSLPLDMRWMVTEGVAWNRYYARDFAAAEEGFRAVLLNKPDAPLSLKGLGFVFFSKGMNEEGAARVAASVKLKADLGLETYQLPAKRLLEAGLFGWARTILDVGVKAYPEAAVLQVQLAKALVGLHDDRLAGQWTARAAERDPAYVDPLFDGLNLPAQDAVAGLSALGWAMYAAGDNERAYYRFNQLVATAPERGPEFKRGRGFVLYRLGRYEEALPDLLESQPLEPMHLPPLDDVRTVPDTGEIRTIRYSAGSVLGWTYLRLDRLKEAEDQFRRVVENHPDWADALAGYGQALRVRGKNEEAANAFQKALALWPGYPEAQEGLAAVTAASSTR